MQSVDFTVLATHLGDAILYIAVFFATLAILVFGWGASIYLVSDRNEEERKTGRKRMTWGVVTLFELFVLWIIVHTIVGYF